MAKQPSRQGMSESEYARHLGISQPAVNQAKRAGRIVMFPDGSIDQEESDRKYFEMTDLVQSERGRVSPGPGKGEGPRANHTSQYMRVRVMREAVAAQLGREKLARVRGEVIDRGQAAALVFAMARQERDAWLTWPTRVAAAIAAELGTPESPLPIHAVQVCLERHVREQLRALPELDAEVFPAGSEGGGEDE